MTNVIRPTFGKRPPPASSTNAPAAEYRPLRSLGKAAGYIVALMEDEGPQGPAVKVVIGNASGNTVEAIALMAHTPAGKAEAEAAALAVLRALEIVETDSGPSTA